MYIFNGKSSKLIDKRIIKFFSFLHNFFIDTVFAGTVSNFNKGQLKIVKMNFTIYTSQIIELGFLGLDS